MSISKNWYSSLSILKGNAELFIQIAKKTPTHAEFGKFSLGTETHTIHWNTPNKANERKGPTHSKHERRFSTQKSYNISMYLFETVSFAIGDIFRGLFANLFSCSCHCCCCRWYSVRLLVLWWVFCVHFLFAMWFLCSLSSHVRLFAAKYFSQIFSKRTFFSVWPLRTVAIEKNQCNAVRRIR